MTRRDGIQRVESIIHGHRSSMRHFICEWISFYSKDLLLSFLLRIIFVVLARQAVNWWRWVPCIPAVNLVQEGLIMKRWKTWPCFLQLSIRLNGTTASNLNPAGVFSILQSNRKFYHIYTVTIVIHKSHNLIGTEGIAKFGPKQGLVFMSSTMSLYWPKRHHQVKEHRETRDSSS